MPSIYLDCNATTPIDPVVFQTMLPFLGDDAGVWKAHFGTPPAATPTAKAQEAVEEARGHVAALLGADPDEIVFTGSGTEASNHALKGVVFARLLGFFGRLFGRKSAAHIVTSAIEHPATLPAMCLSRTPRLPRYRAAG